MQGAGLAVEFGRIDHQHRVGGLDQGEKTEAHGAAVDEVRGLLAKIGCAGARPGELRRHTSLSSTLPKPSTKVPDAAAPPGAGDRPSSCDTYPVRMSSLPADRCHDVTFILISFRR